MTADLYSQAKPIYWLDRLADLRAGRKPVPVHVQLILSDLCNHDCLPAGSMVECPGGLRPIETIRAGDVVTGPDGNPVRVREARDRLADDLYEIVSGGRTVRCTGNHPVLTQDGWKEARHLSTRDSAVVRVRVRTAGNESGDIESSSVKEPLESIRARPRHEGPGASNQGQEARIGARERSGWKSAAVRLWVRFLDELESAIQEVGRVRFWASSFIVTNTLQLEGRATSQVGAGHDRAGLPLWLRSACAEVRAPGLLDGLRFRASERWQDRVDVGGRQEPQRGADAKEQSDARSRSSKKGGTREGSRRVADQGGTSFLSLGEAEQVAGELPWKRQAMGESSKPGLPGCCPEEGHRDHNLRDLQRRSGGASLGRRLWGRVSRALFGERLAMPGGVLSRGSPQEIAEGSDSGGVRLRIAGIELERGLELRPIDSIRRLEGEHRVYNFACPPIEAYIADGVVVHNCGFCAYRMSAGLSREMFSEGNKRNPKRMISPEKAAEIINDCADIGVRAIQFTGGGEPTMHPQHLELFALAQQRGMMTSLVTNGIRIDASSPAVQAMTWIRVSVDAGTPETYGAVRGVSSKHWNMAWGNITSLAEQCKGTVSTGFVVTMQNYRELSQMVELAQGAGVANVRVGAVFSSDGAEYYKNALSDVRASIAQAKERFGDFIIDLFDRRIEDLEAGSPKEPLCGYQYLTTYIGGDLGVYRCCNTAYTRIGKVADLNERRFADLFGGPIQAFDARQCQHCQFLGQNRAIAATQTQPMHAEFV